MRQYQKIWSKYDKTWSKYGISCQSAVSRAIRSELGRIPGPWKHALPVLGNILPVRAWVGGCVAGAHARMRVHFRFMFFVL